MGLHSMNAVDAAWLHMDGPVNPAVVNALVTTSRPLAAQEVGLLIRQRLLPFERFRQRVVEPTAGLGMPQWEDVEEFDVDAHLHQAALPRPADAQALRRLIGELVSEPLPRDRPLWQVHLIDIGKRASAMLLRYHHCIGDGMAMMRVAAALFDRSPHGERVRQGPPADMPEEASLLSAAFDALAHPGQVVDGARLVLDGATVLVRELLEAADPASPLKGEFGFRQGVAWSPPFKLGLVKDIAAPFNAKVNDVLVAAVAGALRSYLEHRGVDLRHRSLRAMVPVNLRPPERGNALGNEFGLVILPLPIEERDPVRRVARAQERMSALKRSSEPMAMKWLLEIFGRGPKPVQEFAQTLFGSKTSLVLTNVAGPDRRLYLAGAPVDRMLFWVPHPGDEVGMGLSLLSYHGHVTLGVIADARLVPDPEFIADAFVAELATLAGRLGAASARRGSLAPGVGAKR